MSKLLEHTSYGQHGNAKLVLEDGSVFEGYSCGASGEVYGEVCFNTSLEGYLEVISDPSYAGQIITMTYPQIGNYGVNRDDLQADTLALRGLVVHEMCFTPSNWRSEISLPDFLKEQNVVAIGGIDTRSLTTHLRDHGAQRGVLSTTDFDTDSLLAKVRASESIVGVNLAKTVSRSEPTSFTELPQSQSFALDDPKDSRYRVVAYDCGVKKSILQGLIRVGCELTVVPWNTPAEEVLSLNPDGVFLSNGPGIPKRFVRLIFRLKNSSEKFRFLEYVWAIR